MERGGECDGWLSGDFVSSTSHQRDAAHGSCSSLPRKMKLIHALLFIVATLPLRSEEPDYKSLGLKELQAKADTGDVKAWRAMGDYYMGGHANDGTSGFSAQAAYDAKDGELKNSFSYEAGEERVNWAKASEFYEKAASRGDKTAIRKLAINLAEGKGIKRNIALANANLERAGGMGDALAYYILATYAFNGIGTKKDYARANQYYEEAGGLGMGEAWLALGNNHSQGVGGPQDWKKAAEYFRLGGENGDAMAYRNLAVCYMNGDGVPKDLAKANQFFLKAGEMGDAVSWRQLGSHHAKGLGTDRDMKRANEYYLKAGKMGDGGGYMNLATSYAKGDGVAQDFKLARIFYTLAGDSGQAQAYAVVASYFLEGKGVAKDTTKSREFLTKAAELGELNSQKLLAIRLLLGDEYPLDLPEAAKWYERAADQGDDNAQEMIGDAYFKGRGVIKNEAVGLKWYRLSARQGNINAKFSLAVILSRDKATLAESNQMFEEVVASDKGSVANRAGACRVLGAGYYEGSVGLSKDVKRAGDLLFRAGSLYEELIKAGTASEEDHQRMIDSYKEAASLGNSDATKRVKQGFAKPALTPKNAGTKTSPQAVSPQADRLIREAREALDEKGDLSVALQKAQAGLLLLDENNEAHIAQWAHAHATIAGALVELAHLAVASQKNSLCKNAVEYADRGAFQMKPLAKQLKAQWPDLFARLMEERVRAFSYLILDDNLDEGETRKGWRFIEIDAGFALSAAKKDLVKARVHMAFSEGYFVIGEKLKDRAMLVKAQEHAKQALTFTTESGDKDYISRAEVVHAMALMVITLADGGGGAFDPDRIEAKDEIVHAAGQLQKRLPASPFTRKAVKWKDAILNYSDKVLNRAVFGALDAFFNTPDSAATTEWNNRLRTMSGANAAARGTGSPPPYPGIP